MTDAATAVNNVLVQNINIPLSLMQREILVFLKEAPRPTDNADGTEYNGALPRTGDLVDAVGRARDNAGYAAVSRSLDRLWRAGLVEGRRAEIQTRGKGRGWLITEAGLRSLNSDPQLAARRGRPRRS